MCPLLGVSAQGGSTVYTFFKSPTVYALYCVLPVLFCYFKFLHLPFIPATFFLAVFILMQLYCLYYTDEGHCIVTEMFDTNLNLVVIQLVRERKKSYMDIPNHTGLYKKW